MPKTYKINQISPNLVTLLPDFFRSCNSFNSLLFLPLHQSRNNDRVWRMLLLKEREKDRESERHKTCSNKSKIWGKKLLPENYNFLLKKTKPTFVRL